MWQSGDISVMKNLPHSYQGRVYSSTLGARCVCRGERQRHYGGWGVLNAVVRSSYFVTVGQCRIAEVCRKGTLGSVLAWRAASLLLIRLLFVLKPPL